MEFFRGGYSLNRIKQLCFVVEYVYLAFLCILIIKRYQPIKFDLNLYSLLILDITVTLLYSIALYYSGKEKNPSWFEIIVRIIYLYIAAKLLVETRDPSVQIIIVLPTVIMALRYSFKYTLIIAFMTSLMIMINAGIYRSYELDYVLILVSFIWILGLLVSISMEVERQMQEEKLKIQERDKLAAIGQMAAGIAHEVRNPLTTIKGFVQLLYKYDVKKNEKLLANYLETIDKEIDRMNDLLKDFLQFAKPVRPKLSANNLNQIVKDISVLIEAQCISQCIRFEMTIDSDLPNIFCDYDQIKQVIVNIALNGIDAMQQSAVKLLQISTDHNQEYVFFNIADSGSGMTEEQQKKIFDPFYTTKENGTGLGLSVCYAIIENHHGRIEVTSLVNKGTVFKIALPRFK